MIIRLLAILVVIGFAVTSPQAKTVRTDTIQVEPIEVPSTGPTIPLDDLPDPLEEAVVEEDVSTPPLPAAEVLYDLDLLPAPVARMHAQLAEAAQFGDFDRLRMVLESNEVPPTLSLTEIGDPIDFLKESSGDPDGLEIMAILGDTLDAGYVHVDVGTPQEMYIWPYFARYPFAQLTREQRVEMYRIVTSADFAEMENYGVWLFYRVGIGKDGTLHYFVAGE